MDKNNLSQSPSKRGIFNKITLYIVVLMMILPIMVKSQPSGYTKVLNQTEIAEKIKKISAKTKTIQSDFIQYKHLEILTDDIKSEGKFSFKQQNMLRWEYSVPYKYLIVSDGKNMWINNGRKTQKYDTKSNKIFKEVNDLMIGLLQGNILESKNFELIFFENKKKVLAVLKPQTNEMKSFLSEIHLYFEKLSNYNVCSIKMLESSGDYTLIDFFNRQYNVQIPNSIFTVR